MLAIESRGPGALSIRRDPLGSEGEYQQWNKYQPAADTQQAGDYSDKGPHGQIHKYRELSLRLLKRPSTLLINALVLKPEVRIRSGDVAIALTRPDKISVQNIFPATVEEIAETPESLVDARLNIGCPLLSRITPAAKADLKLTPGQQVYALVKSVAISRGNANGLAAKG